MGLRQIPARLSVCVFVCFMIAGAGFPASQITATAARQSARAAARMEGVCADLPYTLEILLRLLLLNFCFLYHQPSTTTITTSTTHHPPVRFASFPSVDRPCRLRRTPHPTPDRHHHLFPSLILRSSPSQPTSPAPLAPSRRTSSISSPIRSSTGPSKADVAAAAQRRSSSHPATPALDQHGHGHGHGRRHPPT